MCAWWFSHINQYKFIRFATENVVAVQWISGKTDAQSTKHKRTKQKFQQNSTTQKRLRAHTRKNRKIISILNTKFMYWHCSNISEDGECHRFNRRRRNRCQYDSNYDDDDYAVCVVFAQTKTMTTFFVARRKWICDALFNLIDLSQSRWTTRRMCAGCHQMKKLVPTLTACVAEYRIGGLGVHVCVHSSRLQRIGSQVVFGKAKRREKRNDFCSDDMCHWHGI